MSLCLCIITIFLKVLYPWSHLAHTNHHASWWPVVRNLRENHNKESKVYYYKILLSKCICVQWVRSCKTPVHIISVKKYLSNTNFAYKKLDHCAFIKNSGYNELILFAFMSTLLTDFTVLCWCWSLAKRRDTWICISVILEKRSMHIKITRNASLKLRPKILRVFRLTRPFPRKWQLTCSS